MPQLGSSAGQALLNQLRSAAPPQVQPDQLTSAGAALLAQLQAANRTLQQPQQPNLAQQPGANLLAQLQARSLAQQQQQQQQQQQAASQAAGLTNSGMNLLAQLQRASAGLPSGGEQLLFNTCPLWAIAHTPKTSHPQTAYFFLHALSPAVT